MFGVATSDDYQPVAWVGRYPIHATTLLVIAHVTAMVLGCFLIAFGAESLLNYLFFDSAAVLHGGAFWQLLTYAFVHPPRSLIWFAIEMYMLFTFGREVERFIGRRAFVGLYALLLFMPPVFLTVWGLAQRTGLSGSQSLHFGMFIAFAAIYPGVELSMLRIPVKWIAAVLVAASTLQLLAYHVWSELAVLWLSVGLAFFFIRLRGVGPELVWWSNLWNWRARSRFQVLQSPPPRPRPRRVVEPDDVLESIDPLLDKISTLGLASLTPSERRALERARVRLLKKSR